MVGARIETMKHGGIGSNQYQSKDANLHLCTSRSEAVKKVSASPSGDNAKK
jgi:hypothetical protein